jgi:hypothetical protein
VQYELQITLRRSNRKTLLDDFAAVERLLEEREAQRSPSAESAIRAAERILERKDAA